MLLGLSAMAAGKIVFVDTAGGANFQEFFNTWVIPEANRLLPFEVEYVLSKGPEVVERLKAQSPGGGDMHVILFKADGFVAALEDEVALEVLVGNSLIPNAEKIPAEALALVLGRSTEQKGLQFWREQFSFIYNKKFVPNPPTSFIEFYDRKEEWRGHIGIIETDAGSIGGRAFMYDLLRAFGVDWSIPFDELQGSAAWVEATDKVREMAPYFYQPAASGGAALFEQFLKEDVWITEYVIDFTLWSRDRDRVPDTVAASYASEGNDGGDTLIAIPSYIPSEDMEEAVELVNFLLSDYVQLNLFVNMWEYPGTDIWDIVPSQIWDSVPRMEDLNRNPVENSAGFTWVTEHGMELLR